MPFQHDPELAQVMLQMSHGQTPPPPLKRGDVDGRRAMIAPGIRALAGPELPAKVSTVDFHAESSDGAHIAIRWYHKHHQEASPAVVYIHGGGMILGSIDDYHTVVARYADETGIPFLAVDYRLAPEFAYPKPVEDVYAGVSWLFKHAHELRVDVTRIAIMGDSGGGGLAAAAALLARQQSGPLLAKMILLSPMLDDRTTESDAHMAAFLSWTTADNDTGWDALLGASRGSEAVPESAVPGRLRKADGLPPLYIEVGELDLFRDESLKFAAKFWEAGISTELHVYPGCSHGFDLFSAKSTSIASNAFENRHRAIRSIQPAVGKSAVSDSGANGSRKTQ